MDRRGAADAKRRRGPSPSAASTAAERSDVIDKAEILAGPDAPLLDARGAARFEGSEPDPRPGVAAGHIPGARNLPFASLYHEDGTLRSLDEIRRLFADAGVDPAATVRRHLRIGRYRQFADFRRASARRQYGAAL